MGRHRRLRLGPAATARYFITSVEKGIAASVETAVLAAAHGTFKGGFYVGTLANGGVSPGPYHDFAGKIPASVTSELATITTGIENGTISVEPVQLPGGGGHAGHVGLLRLLRVTHAPRLIQSRLRTQPDVNGAASRSGMAPGREGTGPVTDRPGSSCEAGGAR